MISKKPHLTGQPAEWRTALTNEQLNISPSCPSILLHQLRLFIHLFRFLLSIFKTYIFLSPYLLCFVLHVHESTAPSHSVRLISLPGPSYLRPDSVSGWRGFGHQLSYAPSRKSWGAAKEMKSCWQAKGVCDLFTGMAYWCLRLFDIFQTGLDVWCSQTDPEGKASSHHMSQPIIAWVDQLFD